MVPRAHLTARTVVVLSPLIISTSITKSLYLFTFSVVLTEVLIYGVDNVMLYNNPAKVTTVQFTVKPLKLHILDSDCTWYLYCISHFNEFLLV